MANNGRGDEKEDMQEGTWKLIPFSLIIFFTRGVEDEDGLEAHISFPTLIVIA